MKKILSLLACIGLSVASHHISAQVSIGLRDSRYANISYACARGFSATFEQSIFAEKLPCQYFRIYAGYRTELGRVECTLRPFYGMTYNNIYRNLGAMVDARLPIAGPFALYGTLNPLYDSTFGYTTCFRAGALVRVTDDIAVKGDFNTVPEYRESEKQLRAGLEFNVGNLSFSPMISMPVEGNGKYKSLRVLAGFTYTFR